MLSRMCIAVLAFVSMPSAVTALSSPESNAQLARSRLHQALSSPSGKLTLSPEIMIPEPTDPTAILLQSNAIKTLSERIRSRAKANSAWVSGSINSVQTFCVEQEQARGNFPGPVPVVFYPLGGQNRCSIEDMEALAESGAAGLVISVGPPVASPDELVSSVDSSSWVTDCATALTCGLQPIPEITVSDATAASWTEAHVTSMVETLVSTLSFEPVSVLLTVDNSETKDDEDAEVSLPPIPKALAKKIPILGSVRVTAGENRMGIETARFKDAGFTGAILRSDCVPGFRLNPDLDMVGRFWSACIGDLKSTKSKNFSFRSKNKMEKSMPLEWVKYQQNIVESGALGAAEDNYAEVDSKSGEYKGF